VIKYLNQYSSKFIKYGSITSDNNLQIIQPYYIENPPFKNKYEISVELSLNLKLESG